MLYPLSECLVLALACLAVAIGSVSSSPDTCSTFRAHMRSLNMTEQGNSLLTRSLEEVQQLARTRRAHALWTVREGGHNFEGDIVMPLSCTAGTRSAGASGPAMLWPGGVIPYAVSAEFSGEERTVIERALRAFEQHSCVRVRPRRAGRDADSVLVVKGDGCSSAVGRQGGQQTLSLDDGCVHTGTIVHEFLHAAGFWHEQSRPDRDTHVRIHWNNVPTAMRVNFQKYEWHHGAILSEAYDIESVMHYNKYAFAADPHYPTISAVIAAEERNMGQRVGFSRLDIKKLNKLYGCETTTTTTSTDTEISSSASTAQRGGACQDGHANCRYWSRLGECRTNPEYMLTRCRKSCRVCTTTTTALRSLSAQEEEDDQEQTQQSSSFISISPDGILIGTSRNKPSD